MTISVLVIENRDGFIIEAWRNDKLAQESLFEYVKQEWPSEFPDEAMPEDPGVAIDQYFEDNYDEFYYLELVPLKGEEA
jgi:hypothetical protein